MIRFRPCPQPGTSDSPESTPAATPTAVLVRRFFLFTACGAVGTLAHYATMIGLVQGIGVSPVPASATGFLVGMAVNYVLNYRYTFRSDKRHREAATKFFVVGCCGLGLNTVLMWIGTDLLAIHYLVTQLGATGLVLLWNFGANHLWTFARVGDRR